MRRRKWALGIAVVALAVPGNSCGPFFTGMVFVHQPDLEDVLNGRLGVVHGTFSVSTLAMSYRVLSGVMPTAAEKTSVLGQADTPQDPNNPGYSVRANSTPNAMNAWIAERAEVMHETSDAGLKTDSNVPGQQWDTYENCLNDAFVNAAKTLATRARDHSTEPAELAEWVNGQDAVFSNCNTPTNMPAVVQKPDWLVKDRAYQTAAAHFYRAEFDEARKEFEAIAADRSSPWHALADYLVGRCLIRQATLAQPDKADDAMLKQAGEQFARVAKGGGQYAGPATELLNFVDLRVNPDAAAVRLGDAMSRPDTRLKQHLVDLSYLLEHSGWPNQEESRKSDLMDWMLTMQAPAKGPEHAKERWRQTGNVAWLVAAMSAAQSPDPELLRAAAAVPYDSPAWATLTYLRLETLPAGSAARAEVEQVLNELVQKKASPHAVNEFTILARQKADRLEDFVRLAPMEPVGQDNDVYGPLPAATVVPTGQTPSTMAGLSVNVAGVKRLDLDSAVVLNQYVPLKELVELVLDSKWPKQLRFELAMAVWTRAVLLDHPEEARKLTVAMVEGEPGWKTWLAAYDAAGTADERRVTALLALMRFPSVRPYINAGAGRDEGFVGYSSYRDNWWCAYMAANDYSTASNYSAAPPNPDQRPPVQVPAFVTPAMEAQATREQAELATIGDAPEYFGKAALAWVRAHPKDERDPEVLGFAFRAMRNGCNLEKSYTLRQQVFDMLHTKFGASEWAKRFPQFTMDNQ